MIDAEYITTHAFRDDEGTGSSLAAPKSYLRGVQCHAASPRNQSFPALLKITEAPAALSKGIVGCISFSLASRISPVFASLPFSQPRWPHLILRCRTSPSPCRRAPRTIPTRISSAHQLMVMMLCCSFSAYAAHVATIVTLPGETLGPVILTMILALIYPMTGMQKCIRLLGKYTLLRQDQSPLNDALRAGALCEVVRTPTWEPLPKEKISNVKVTGIPILGEVQGPNSDARTDIKLQLVDNQARGPARQNSTGDTIPDHFDGPAEEYTPHSRTSGDNKQDDAIEPHEDPNRRATSDKCLQVSYSIGGVERFSPAKGTLPFRGRAIHGRFFLPQGYALSIIPTNATVLPLSAISCSAHSSDLLVHYSRHLCCNLPAPLWKFYALQN